MIEQTYHRDTLDRLAITLSGLCLVHCVATVVFLGFLSSAAAWLGNPLIHEVGLAMATLVGTVALVAGALENGTYLPGSIGGLGLGAMAAALTMPHGSGEAVYTVLGVSLLALAHWLNSAR